MNYDDWIQVGGIALGAGLGTWIGYQIRVRRTVTRRDSQRRDVTREQALPQAALIALAAFFACALVEDVATGLRGVKPGFVFAKYIFAVAFGVGQYLYLRRQPAPDAASAS